MKDKHHLDGFLYTRWLGRGRYPTCQDHILYTDYPVCMECDAVCGTDVADHEPKKANSHVTTVVSIVVVVAVAVLGAVLMICSCFCYERHLT